MQTSYDQFRGTGHNHNSQFQLLTGTPCSLLEDILYGLVTMIWYVTVLAERLAYRGLTGLERPSHSPLEPLP
jgi:hypothetical protein